MQKHAKIFSLAFALALTAGVSYAGSGCGTAKVVDAAKEGSCTTSASVQTVSNESYEKSCAEKCAKDTMEIVNVSNESSSCAEKCAKDAMEIVNVSNHGDHSGPYTVGSKVDSFELVHAQSGEKKALKDLAGEKATVLIFWNKDCPYVEGRSGARESIEEFAAAYKEKGVNVIAIDAGVNVPVDTNMEYSKNLQIPLLLNPESTVAAKFNAQYTPETFVLDSNMQVQYAGAFHTMSGGEARMHAKNAVKDILNGETPVVQSARGVGCSVKYADGVKPSKSKDKPTA